MIRDGTNPINQRVVERKGTQLTNRLAMYFHFFCESFFSGWAISVTVVRRLLRLSRSRGPDVINPVPFEYKATCPLDVIVADDTRVQRLLLLRILTVAGHRIRVAFDGEQALELATLSPPDLLITDLEMPIRDGFDLIDAIRHSDNHFLRQISIIVCSGCSQSYSLNRALDCGATSFVTKPVHQRELLMAINNLPKFSKFRLS